MSSDSVMRVLLAGILACLLILVFQGAGDDGESTLWGRYSVIGMRAGAPVLIRTDTETGQVWKLELRGGGDRWIAFSEAEAEEADVGDDQASSRESETQEVAREERAVVEPPGAPPQPSARATGTPGLPPGAVLEEEIATMADALANGQLPDDMRVWAAEQLGRFDERASTTALLRAFSDPSPAVVLAVLEAVSGRDDPRVEPMVEALAEHEDERVVERALSLD